MKKILSLLGAVSLTATASLAVVSCTNWNDYNNFAKWINETKVQYKGNTNEITQKGSSSVIYIGAKDNASSLSFQAAVEEFLDPTGHDFNTVLQNLSSNHEDLNWDVNVASGHTKTNYSQATTWGTASVKKETPKKKSAYWTKTDYNDDQKYMVESKNLEQGKIGFKSIILDKMSQLWTNKTTKKIVSDVVEPNIAQSLFSADGFKNSSKADNKAITQNINTISGSLTSTKGPIFLTVRNGVITGFVSGFELFHEFNQTKNSDIDGPVGSEAKQRRKDSLTKLLTAITEELNSNIEDHLINNINGSPTLYSKQTGKQLFATWDEGSGNFDKDKKITNRPYQYILTDEYLNQLNN